MDALEVVTPRFGMVSPCIEDLPHVLRIEDHHIGGPVSSIFSGLKPLQV